MTRLFGPRRNTLCVLRPAEARINLKLSEGRMFSVRHVCAVLLAAAAVSAITKPPPEDPENLLEKIRGRTAAYLAQLRNYTCHEVMNRLVRHGDTWNQQDRVDIEVAFIGQEELFARPGENRFTERVIDRVVQHGTVGNGAFGTLIQIITAGSVADFKYGGMGKKDGHKTFRYDFRVPLERSHFLIKHSGKQATVPFEGGVWVDTATLDLVRVDIHVKHIAPNLSVRGLQEVIHYELMHIGDTEVLLPRKSELATTDDDGNYSLNLVQLRNCYEFKSDSIVQYGAPKEGSAARQRPDQ